MIAKLTGIIADIEEDNITLDVGGVGYLVYIPNNSFFSSDIGESQSLYIQTIVREDAISLYGFRSSAEKQIFNLLISVPGVGAKIALVMLSQLTPSDLSQAILFEDIKTLKSINGIGVKVAQRLVNELKDKITKITTIPNLATDKKGIMKESSSINEAIEALLGLGYSKFEIIKVLDKIQAETKEDLGSEQLIKQFLMYMAQGLGN
ncbi:MAG: Holliday junction branch migration protein RuvA [Alphaproteobacteria bacterium]|jgi:Holliday junction DNA helicase RuvA|nr:Holliday junction branch migration protein RuvA [Alphaproteobacteria bacterium]